MKKEHIDPKGVDAFASRVFTHIVFNVYDISAMRATEH